MGPTIISMTMPEDVTSCTALPLRWYNWLFMSYNRSIFILTDKVRSTREGNAFSRVCVSIDRWSQEDPLFLLVGRIRRKGASQGRILLGRSLPGRSLTRKEPPRKEPYQEGASPGRSLPGRSLTRKEPSRKEPHQEGAFQEGPDRNHQPERIRQVGTSSHRPTLDWGTLSAQRLVLRHNIGNVCSAHKIAI